MDLNLHNYKRRWQDEAQTIGRGSFGRNASLWQAEFKSITATEDVMELPDTALKIGIAGKWQHFRKDFSCRLVQQRGRL